MGLFDFMKPRVTRMLQRQATMMYAERITANYSGLDQLYEYFVSDPTVYSVVSLIADKVSQGLWTVNRVKDEKKLAKYKSMSIKGMQQYMLTKAQTLEPDDNSPLQKLLLKPNPSMGQDGLMKLLVINYLVGGAGALWMNRGGMQVKPVELWPLSTKDLTIRTKDLLTISGYSIDSLPNWSLPKDDVIYWPQANPMFETDGSHLYGLPPLRAALIELISSKEGRLTLGSNFKNNGSKGVMYEDADAPYTLTQSQVDEYRKIINEQINGGKNANRVAFMGAKLGYVNLSQTNVDLEIIDGLNLTKEGIYNVFGVDPVIFSTVGSTYANKEQAQKALITNVVAPTAQALRDELNRQLLPLFHDKGYYLDVTFDHLPEMASDLEKMAAAMSNMPFLTYDEKRIASGYQEKGGAYATAYVPAGVVPIEDAGLDLGSEPQPNSLDL
jgi:HK97 family phage portal protein